MNQFACCNEDCRNGQRIEIFDATHNDLSLPQRGQVTFYVRTDSGVLTATVTEDDLGSHRSPFYKLGDSAQTIITDIA